MAPLTRDLSNVDITMDVYSQSVSSSLTAASAQTRVLPCTRTGHSGLALAPPCHIDRLPHELLDMIITFASQPEFKWPVDDFYIYGMNTLHVIPNVCRTWRAILLRHPSFYQHIAVGTSDPEAKEPTETLPLSEDEQPLARKWVEEHIQRSAGKPLHAILQPIFVGFPPYMEPLLAVSDRWQTAAIECDVRICADDLAALGGRLGQLRHLSLTHWPAHEYDALDRDEPIRLRLTVFKDAPMLTVVELCGRFAPHRITPVFPENQLQYLSCSDTQTVDLFKLLSTQTQSLRQLRWTSNVYGTGYDEADLCVDTTLPHLTKLVLDDVYEAFSSGALDKLYLPALQELVLYSVVGSKAFAAAAQVVEIVKGRAAAPDTLVVRYLERQKEWPPLSDIPLQ
ncbi:hypothetical protein BD626DRAFT_565321 [Schizophyllum amplum]|uniref:F-box domain-containing protein n=1 Tax=Schizophyllum amplum TaxID=97359 RepID=A0A550CUM9_9AGAR|nr:hypothetical protein BD626DRAFT_565321 [Auriculariopsis ampla]